MKKYFLFLAFYLFSFPFSCKSFSSSGNIYITSIESDCKGEITFKKNKKYCTVQLTTEAPLATGIKIGSFQKGKDTTFVLHFLNPFFINFFLTKQWGEFDDIKVVKRNCCYEASYLQMAYTLSDDCNTLLAKNLITLPEELFDQERINLKLKISSQTDCLFTIARI